MSENRPSIECFPVDLTFLASLLRADSLLGVEDPFVGWLADEIQSVWQETRQRLAGQRYLAISPDGDEVLDTGVAALIATCAFPDLTLIATVTRPDGGSRATYYHIGRDLAVERAPELCAGGSSRRSGHDGSRS